MELQGTQPTSEMEFATNNNVETQPEGTPPAEPVQSRQPEKPTQPGETNFQEWMRGVMEDLHKKLDDNSQKMEKKIDDNSKALKEDSQRNIESLKEDSERNIESLKEDSQRNIELLKEELNKKFNDNSQKMDDISKKMEENNEKINDMLYFMCYDSATVVMCNFLLSQTEMKLSLIHI